MQRELQVAYTYVQTTLKTTIDGVCTLISFVAQYCIVVKRILFQYTRILLIIFIIRFVGTSF